METAAPNGGLDQGHFAEKKIRTIGPNGSLVGLDWCFETTAHIVRFMNLLLWRVNQAVPHVLQCLLSRIRFL